MFMKKFFAGVFISAFFIGCADKAEEKPPTETASATTETKKPATEVLDMSEADGVKAGFAALANRDVNGMTASYADDIAYRWSGGDSAMGKQAVIDYWNGRLKLIDSINFSDVILLPIKINESQNPQYARLGKWVMAWNFSHVKYKNGKWLHFWVHTDYHYNDAGKVDVVIQYIDRHPIMEATKGL
jgi:predicted phage tail protein